jgi:pyruvate dehydrogenase E1 component alpha subunit
MYDGELYRTKDEVAQWKQRDPVPLFQQQLRDEGDLTDADLDNMETAIAAEIAEAVSYAEMGPWEPLEDLTKDVYTRVRRQA